MTHFLRIAVVLLIVVASVAFWLLSGNDNPDTVANTLQTEIAVPASDFSYLDIVNNPEFREGYKQALRRQDEEAMAKFQQKAVEIGEAANLPAEQMALLEGPRGQHYLQFRAARQLFNDEFQVRFNALQNIESLKTRYPQAQDLFAKADALIAQRDAQIVSIAREMAGEATDLAPYLAQAREQWMANVAKTAGNDAQAQ